MDEPTHERTDDSHRAPPEAAGPVDAAPRRGAPPTQPGTVASRSSEGTPSSARHAVGWSVGGVLFFPLGIVGIVCGIVALRRIGRAERRVGSGLAVAGIVLGIADILLIVPLALMVTGLFAGLSAAQSVTGTARAQMHAVSMYQWASAFAQNQDEYPAHVAQLALLDYGGSIDRLLTQYPSPEERANAWIDGLDVTLLDDGEESHDKLRAALEATDLESPSYTFAGHTYIRLAAPTDHVEIVFSYHVEPNSGFYLFMMDDGSTQLVPPDGWDPIWAADASARTAEGLPPFDPD